MPLAPGDLSAGARALPAPAKVNLGLRVQGRRADGYHLLESVFVPLDLQDELSVAIEPAASASVSLAVEIAADAPAGLAAEVPTGATNLAYRAAEAFLEAAGLTARVAIELVKRTPAGGGLGGGSSDAGAVLRALSELAPGALAGQMLFDLALGLGADVPFFLDPRPALVGGIGDLIEPLERLPPLCLVLANPGTALSTAEVFAASDALGAALTPSPPGSTLRALSALVASDPADVAARAAALGALLENDLEAAAARLCPPVRRLQEQLRQAGAMATGMSGSGATVFGVFADSQSAAACLETAAPGVRGWWRPARTAAASTLAATGRGDG